MLRRPPRSTLFPSRRSSDLTVDSTDSRSFSRRCCSARAAPMKETNRGCGSVGFDLYSGWNRSEEHTSELQSQSNLVCRLLLEKKKKKTRKKKSLNKK